MKPWKESGIGMKDVQINWEQAISYCENTNREDCAITIEGKEKRTDFGKTVLHIPYYANLVNKKLWYENHIPYVL